jgi:hypothetical protein
MLSLTKTMAEETVRNPKPIVRVILPEKVQINVGIISQHTSASPQVIPVLPVFSSEFMIQS